MIITIANEKGGSGKTTLAINLATWIERARRAPVLLLDTDPQRSTEVFANIRAEANLPQLFSILSKHGESIRGELNALDKHFNDIIIDTGGRDSKDMRTAMIASNVVIIPTIPSQLDFDVLENMLDIYAQAVALKPNLRAVIVVNRASPNPFLYKVVNDLKKVINEIKKEKELKNAYLFDSVLYERLNYRKAISEGKTLKELSPQTDLNGRYTDMAIIDFEEFYLEFETLRRKILEENYPFKQKTFYECDGFIV